VSGEQIGKKISSGAESRTGVFEKRFVSVKFAESKKNRMGLRKINAQAKVKLPLEQIKIVFAKGSEIMEIFLP